MFSVLSVFPSEFSQTLAQFPIGPGGEPWTANAFYKITWALVFATVLSLAGSYFLVPYVSKLTFAAGLRGKDLHKREGSVLPEATGTASVLVWFVTQFFLTIFAFMPFQFMTSLLVSSYTFILGFGDDVLDLRWRHKVILSTLLSIPLLVSFPGDTRLALPQLVMDWLSAVRGLYLPSPLVWIGLLIYTIFCVNAINIHAGVNGLEIGTSIVIALGGLTLNLSELLSFIWGLWMGNPMLTFGQAFAITLNDCSEAQNHMFSLLLLGPFVGVSLGLLAYNWYPARVFVGDSYTYFAGIVLAVAGLYGRYAASIFAFHAPQLLNFMLSLPQLLGLWRCPRHRLPHYNPQHDRLEPVSEHLTLLNLTLRILGPLHERTLALTQIVLQLVTVFGVLAFNRLFLSPTCYVV